MGQDFLGLSSGNAVKDYLSLLGLDKPYKKPEPKIGPLGGNVIRDQKTANRLRKKALDQMAGLGLLEFFTGLSPYKNKLENFMGFASNVPLELAGLPFMAFRSKLPKGMIFRGQQKVRPNLDPKYYHITDTLGWMTHFAENPKYAAKYALGGAKHKTIPHNADAEDLLDYSGKKLNPNTFAAIPRARNVLDLVEPNPDDLSAALAAIPKHQRKGLIQDYKANLRGEGWNKNAKESLANDLTHRFNDSNIFRKTQFDAIRYSDEGEPSWAIPEETLNYTTTPWGVPINQDMIGRRYPIPDNPRFLAGPEGIEDVRKRNSLALSYEDKLDNNILEREAKKVKNYLKDDAIYYGPDDYDEIDNWVVIDSSNNYVGGGSDKVKLSNLILPGDKIITKAEYIAGKNGQFPEIPDSLYDKAIKEFGGEGWFENHGQKYIAYEKGKFVGSSGSPKDLAAMHPEAQVFKVNVKKTADDWAKHAPKEQKGLVPAGLKIKTPYSDEPIDFVNHWGGTELDYKNIKKYPELFKGYELIEPSQGNMMSKMKAKATELKLKSFHQNYGMSLDAVDNNTYIVFDPYKLDKPKMITNDKSKAEKHAHKFGYDLSKLGDYFEWNGHAGLPKEISEKLGYK